MADTKHAPFHRGEGYRCPKCGWSQKRHIYCKGKVTGGGPLEEKKYSCPEEVEGEHMHVVCADCGHITIRGCNPDGSNMAAYKNR